MREGGTEEEMRPFPNFWNAFWLVWRYDRSLFQQRLTPATKPKTCSGLFRCEVDCWLHMVQTSNMFKGMRNRWSCAPIGERGAPTRLLVPLGRSRSYKVATLLQTRD